MTIKKVFYIRDNKEYEAVMKRIEKCYPDVRWNSGHKPTAWKTDVNEPDWVGINENDEMWWVGNSVNGMSGILKVFYVKDAEDAKKVLKQIEEDDPVVRWRGGDRPTDFHPADYLFIFPMWFEINYKDELGYQRIDAPEAGDEETNDFYGHPDDKAEDKQEAAEEKETLTETLFYAKDEKEVRTALERIQQEFPNVRWNSGEKPTGWWNDGTSYPVWLHVCGDRLTYNTTQENPTLATKTGVEKWYQAYSKTDAKHKLKKIHKDMPEVRWNSDDMPHKFIPGCLGTGGAVWIRLNDNGVLKYEHMVKHMGTGTDIYVDGEHDPVNHPDHYTSGSMECIDAMVETQGAEAVQHFCICNAFKYLWRWQQKNGMEDIKKAQWYLNKAVDLEEERKED